MRDASLHPARLSRQTNVLVTGSNISYSSPSGRVGGVLGESPLSAEHPFFAVSISDIGRSGTICVGASHGAYNLQRQPGAP